MTETLTTRQTRNHVARLLRLAAAIACVFCARQASAYPWMIRHEYTACAQCHADPSGGGPLSAYGRAMGEVVLRTHYGAEPAGEDAGEPGSGAKFLWGAIPLPEGFDLGGSFRAMSYSQRIADIGLEHRLIYMQSDLTATIQTERWVASASLGYLPKGGLLAAITRAPEDNLVSRHHWVGYRLDEGATTLIRAGRMNLPFGIRDLLHTLSMRKATRTNIDDHQQHGVALSYSGETVRAEIMAILGNYQIRPDDYRERGYSGYVEWTPSTTVAIGASSRIAHVGLDPDVLRPAFRHAHGAFLRWSTPWKPLVLMSEADYVLDSFKDLPRKQGIQAMAQADLEVVQGIHYQLLGEAGDFGEHGSGASYSAWATFAWFFASHVDVRLDGIYSSASSAAGRYDSQALLVQAHLYL